MSLKKSTPPAARWGAAACWLLLRTPEEGRDLAVSAGVGGAERGCRGAAGDLRHVIHRPDHGLLIIGVGLHKGEGGGCRRQQVFLLCCWRMTRFVIGQKSSIKWQNYPEMPGSLQHQNSQRHPMFFLLVLLQD